MKTARLSPNGFLKLETGWRGAFHTLEFTGGPYDYYKGRLHNEDKWFGFCVRAEAASHFDAHLPIVDFSVPDATPEEVGAALKQAILARLAGKNVYVGCMGGWGRTGLALSLITKIVRPDLDPIQTVRGSYTPKAVETREQEAYVRDFDTSDLHRWFIRAAWRSRLPF